MKTRNPAFILLIVFGALILSACSGRGASSTWPGLASDGAVAYMADGLQIYAVDLKSGKDVLTNDGQPMRFPAKSDSAQAFYAPPVLTPDGQLIVSSSGSNHSLYSINPKTFAQNWVFTGAGDSFMGAALVTPETIYAPNGDGTLYALDLKGNLLWKFAASAHALWAQPVTDGELVYVASLDHNIYALNAASGAEVWRAELDGSIPNAPALGPDGTLYMGTLARSLYALSSENGSVQWQKKLEGWVWSTPALDGDVLYYGVTVAKSGGLLQAVDAASGDVLWTFDAEAAVVGSPLVLGSHVILATEPGIVYALDPAGCATLKTSRASDATICKTWGYKIDEQLYTTPYAADDVILVATVQASKLLYGLTPDGALKWSYEPGK